MNEATKSITSAQDIEQMSPDFWQNLCLLTSSPLEADMDSSMHLALSAASGLVEAPIVIVYQAQKNNPLLLPSASVGDAQLFPESLSAQDLVDLSRPQLWIPGKRGSPALQRAARSTPFSFLASAPLGQPNAVIGVVVVAGLQNTPTPHTLPLTQILASILTTILQKFAVEENFRVEEKKHVTQQEISQELEKRITEGVLLLDPTLRIVQCNPSTEMILGYACKEIVGQPVDRILIGPESLIPALESAQQGSATFNLLDTILFRRNGESFPAVLRIFPVQESDKIIAILVLFQDLSEREQIRIQAQNLEQRALLGEVTASFAHEVRNPINNISAGLQLMALNLPKEDPTQEAIARLLQDCDRLANLMKDVLAFARPINYKMEKLDLAVLLQRLLERLHPRLNRMNIQVTTQVESNLPPVYGNLRALEQVFDNIINNALRAMEEKGGTLAIRVQPVPQQESPGHLEVSVADTGPGIPKEIAARIFQPFFTTDSTNGTGLGLAIAKRIITAHKGNINLETFPGGTVFFVQIPIASSE